jgi:predicted DNA-binding transcriptional regulator AlpA
LRKAYSIKELAEYLDAVKYPLSEDAILDLIQKRKLPHQRPFGDMIVFDLNHIDWWIDQQRSNE